MEELKKIKAVPIRMVDFSKYGRYYNMRKENDHISYTKTQEFEDHMIKVPLIDTVAQLGYTEAQAAPCIVSKMEKHDHTEEAIICGADPIILCVAEDNGKGYPEADRICAVILNPGEVAVMNRNVWHDACHGLEKKSGYYYIATAGKKPAEWIEIFEKEVVVE